MSSIFPSIRVFSNESVLCIRWPKYWSFSFNISPYNEHSGLISFKMNWLDLLAVQGTLKSLLHHHNSKASILWRSDFFRVQLSHPYMTPGKTIALTIWAFVIYILNIPLFLLNILILLILNMFNILNIPLYFFHLILIITLWSDNCYYSTFKWLGYQHLRQYFKKA